MEIRVARPGDADVVGAALADAFVDDPVFRWLIPASPRRDRRLLRFFTTMSASYLQSGKPGYLAGRDSGAALWSEPGSTRQLQFDLGQVGAILVAFGAGRIVRAVRTQRDLENQHPEEPHWYLGYLGVRGSRRGQGLGGGLLSEVLTAADAARIPAYTESSNRRNLTLYQRYGFDIVEEFKLLGKGPPVWRLWRRAAR